MVAKSFPPDVEPEARLLRTVLAVVLGALVVGVIALLVSWELLKPFALLCSLVGLGAGMLLLTLFYRRFSHLEVVREKRAASRCLTAVRQEIRSTQQSIENAASTREAIDRDAEKNTSAKEEEFDDSLQRIDAARARVTQEERDDLESALTRTQTSYVEAGLRSATVSDAAIAGVGAKLKERLEINGVTCAGNVSPSRLGTIQGFGEAKSLAVLDWRRTVEADLNRTKPHTVPKAEEARIRESWNQRRTALDAEERAARATLADQLAGTENDRLRRHAENDASEVRSRETLERLTPEEQRLASDFEAFGAITLKAYAEKSLNTKIGGRELGFVGIVVLLAAGMCGQATAGAASVVGLVIDAIPTAAPTVTLTATVTVTQAPTVTLTPTLASTPTITRTPTITLTPTITETPTITGTPTATIPAAAGSRCVPQDNPREVGRVTSVTDGDTIRVLIDGVSYSVRLIGIDTAEQGEPFFYESRNKLYELVSGQIVTLVKDVSETDRYDRLLRYIFLGEVFVNYEMVASGHATAYRYEPDTSCADSFADAESSANASKSGLWAPTPTAPPKPIYIVPPPASDGGGDCDPSYPTVCIKPPPPDLDCGDIPYRRFQVSGSDPHRFDRDGDGIGCES